MLKHFYFMVNRESSLSENTYLAMLENVVATKGKHILKGFNLQAIIVCRFRLWQYFTPENKIESLENEASLFETVHQNSQT